MTLLVLIMEIFCFISFENWCRVPYKGLDFNGNIKLGIEFGFLAQKLSFNDVFNDLAMENQIRKATRKFLPFYYCVKSLKAL